MESAHAKFHSDVCELSFNSLLLAVTSCIFCDLQWLAESDISVRLKVVSC